MICSVCRGSLLDGQHEIRREMIGGVQYIIHVCPEAPAGRLWLISGGSAILIHQVNVR